MVDSSDNNPPGENIELTDPYIGTVIADKYEIQELLGGGGAGLVYKARHIYTKKIVAIKLLFPQLALKSDVVKRFQQEAQAASCLNHPGIVSVYDFGLCNLGPPYMVMDYLPGCSLSDLIEKNGPLDPARTITLFTQIAEALQHAHEKGVVHRDLKPSNFMISTANGHDSVKIVDFGLARPLPSDEDYQKLTQTGQVFGSPFYMSPEQCRGQNADARSDIYSLGCSLYECLLGQPPFIGKDPFDTLSKQMGEAPSGLESIPGDPDIRQRLQIVILKALAKEPQQRYQDIQAFLVDLRQVLQPPDQSWRKRAQTLFKIGQLKFFVHRNRQTKTRQAAVALGLLCLLGGAGGAVAYMLYGNQPPVTDPGIVWQLPEKPTPIVTQDDKISLQAGQFFVKLRSDLGYGETEEVAKELDNIAHFMEKMQRFSDAESQYQRALSIRRKLNGPQSLLATAAISLANCYYQQGKYAQAKPLYLEATGIYQRLWGGDYLDLAKPLSNLGDIYVLDNQPAQAEQAYNLALNCWQQNNLQDSVPYALAISKLADVYLHTHKLPESQQLFEKALPLWLKIEGPLKQNAAFCLIELGKIAEENGNYAEASAKYKEALPILNTTAGHDSVLTGKLMQRYADSLWKQGDWLQSLSIKSKSNQILAKHLK